jgi:hypothetical protein
MAHTYRVLSTPAEWECLREIVEAQGSQLPVEGHAVIFCEFDDDNQPCAYQMMLTTVIAEGLWARDANTNLLRLWRMMFRHFDEHLGGNEGRVLLTLTRGTDDKIGKTAERIGFEKQDFTVFMRRNKCQH